MSQLVDAAVRSPRECWDLLLVPLSPGAVTRDGGRPLTATDSDGHQVVLTAPHQPPADPAALDDLGLHMPDA